jgi:hypothetical protein
MSVFYSPGGNPEVWAERPNGYLSQDEWDAQHPPAVDDSPPTPVAEAASIKMALAGLDFQYLTPRTLAGAATGDSFALAQLARHEEEAAPLRARLAALAEGAA